MNQGKQALRDIAEEMRKRKVNHGKTISPTLVDWAKRIDDAVDSINEQTAVGELVSAGVNIDVLAERVTTHLCERGYQGNPYWLGFYIRQCIEKSFKNGVFINDIDSEGQYISDSANLNCPSCGGSGHVEDSDTSKEKPKINLNAALKVGDQLDWVIDPDRDGSGLKELEQIILAALT